MNSYKVKGDLRTPTITLDHTTGHLELSGRSIPEDSYEIYKPVMKWVDEYTKNPHPKGTLLVMKLDFFNTSSSAFIVNILKAFDRLSKTGHNTTVKWYYEEYDDDMKEYGEDYQSLLKNLKMEILEL